MAPEFAPGSIIVVEPDLEARHADYVVVVLAPGERAVFRQLIEDGSRRYLRALNPAYATSELPPEASIVGVVREQVKQYR